MLFKLLAQGPVLMGIADENQWGWPPWHGLQRLAQVQIGALLGGECHEHHVQMLFDIVLQRNQWVRNPVHPTRRSL